MCFHLKFFSKPKKITPVPQEPVPKPHTSSCMMFQYAAMREAMDENAATFAVKSPL